MLSLGKFLVLGLAIVLALTYAVAPFFKRRQLRKRIPLHTFHQTGLPDTYDSYVKHTRELHYAGYAQFTKKGLPYRVKTSAGGERILLPMKYLSEVMGASQEVFSLPGEMEELLLMRYTGVPQRTDSGTKVTRVELTRNLGNFVTAMQEECEFGFEKYLESKLHDHGWVGIKAYHVFAHIVALISGRVLVGPKLCRDEEWIKLSLDFSTYAFGAARKLRARNQWPWSMWLGSWTEPAVKAVVARRKEGEDLLTPICEERLRRQRDADWKRPEDATQWLLDSHSSSGESAGEVVKSQLRLIMAAIHNTTMSVTNDLFDLLEHPEYIEILRGEVQTVLREEGGWTKQALTKMRKLDSFMKESQRMNPSTPITGKRIVLREHVLHDGLVIPRGAHVAFPSDALNRDPKVYPSPDEFDGLRFYNLRTSEANDTKYNFVTASSAYLNWGQGGHACPGRFFASNEIKLMLAHLLQHYDFRWKAGESRPASANIDWNLLPDREREVEIRRRMR